MAEALDVRSTPPATALLLSRALTRLGAHDAAVGLLCARGGLAGGLLGPPVPRSCAPEGRPASPVEALPSLTAAVALHPDSAGAWFTLAYALRRAHKHEQAEAAYYEAAIAYREALRRDPGDPLSRAYLGVVLFLRGQMAEARDLLEAIRPGESESAIALQRAASSRSSWATSTWPSVAAARRRGESPDSSGPTCSWAGPWRTAGVSPRGETSCGGRGPGEVE